MRHFTPDERLLIVFKRKEAGLTVNQLSKQIHMSKSNLSRIENDKIMVSEENEKILEKRFDIDFTLGATTVEAVEVLIDYLVKLLVFYRLFDDYTREDLDREYDKVYNSIAYPYYMLIKLFIYTVKSVDKKFTVKYMKIFDSLIDQFAFKYQKIYYVSKMHYLYSMKEYQHALEVTEFIESSFSPDDILDSYLYHFKATIYSCLGEQDKVIETLDKAIELTKITNNSVRKLALQITRANRIRLQGKYLDALKYDNTSYEFAQQENVHIYDYALLRNIAWTYYLMDDYETAIKHYKIAEELDIDDDLCFITAYCYFKLAMDCESPSQKLDLRIKCKEYLNKGRKSKNSGIAFPYLIDWLELMLNKKYSLKAEQKLLYCLKKHETTMHVDSRNNIYKFLIEHYEYHQDSKNADYYRKKLQNG